MSDNLSEAIKRVQEIGEQYETNRMRAVLYVAYDHELTDENGLRFAMYDPYTQTDEWVRERFGDDVSAAVYESGNWLSGEDYETLDANEGAQEAIGKVLEVLQSLAPYPDQFGTDRVNEHGPHNETAA